MSDYNHLDDGALIELWASRGHSSTCYSHNADPDCDGCAIEGEMRCRARARIEARRPTDKEIETIAAQNDIDVLDDLTEREGLEVFKLVRLACAAERNKNK